MESVTVSEVDPHPVVPPAFATPFDRLVGGVRALVRREVAADARLAQGERHVRAGVAASGVSLAAFVPGAILVLTGWPVAVVATLAGYAITSAGVLAGSRFARGLALVQVVTMAAGGVDALLAARYGGRFMTGNLLMGVSMLAYSGGVALATLTPAARAWHRARLVERAQRRQASLATWRAGATAVDEDASR